MANQAYVTTLLSDLDAVSVDTEVAAFKSSREVCIEHGCTQTLDRWTQVLGGSGLPVEHIAVLESVPTVRSMASSSAPAS